MVSMQRVGVRNPLDLPVRRVWVMRWMTDDVVNGMREVLRYHSEGTQGPVFGCLRGRLVKASTQANLETVNVHH